MLTRADVAVLTAPFNADEHEFRQGFIYISEGAICARLDAVDPNWSIEILSQSARDITVVNTIARLTVCGISRDGVGTEKINSANEAEKSSATDALKRGARLFGIGRYLLGTPSWVKDVAGIQKWLNHGDSPSVPKLAQQSEPQEGGDFMDAPTELSGKFHYLESVTKGVKKPFRVYQYEFDTSVKVNIFETDKSKFTLTDDGFIPYEFEGTVKKSGIYWNLKSVSNFQ